MQPERPGETDLAALTAPARSEAGDSVTLITQDGKKYRNVKVTAVDTGLSVLGPDGGALIPFHQLPNDLSIFPEKTREEISKAKKVQVFKLGKAQKGGSKDPMMTLFEATLTSNYSKQDIDARKWSNLESDAFVPVFTDELPPAVSLGGVDALQTIHFLNRKIKSGDRVIYFDTKLRAFVCGCPAFCPNGRMRILYADCRSFNPADLNPDQIEKITHDDGTVSIGVYTTNRADSITCHENNGFNYKTHTFVVPVADEGEARMMCKAIIRFIRAFGGR